MCSVQDVEDVIPEPKQERNSDVCMKCGEKAVVVIRVTDGFCRDCFLHHCNHKFRSAFGKSKVVRHNERVLMAYSGSHSSAAMLHMLILSLTEKQHKKFKMQPGVVHIDDTTITNPGCDAENQDKQAEVVALMKETGLPYHHVQLHQALDDRPEKPTNTSDDVTPDDITSRDHILAERLKSAFAAIKSKTAQEEYLLNLRLKLLYSTARLYGYSKLMLGDSAQTIAVTVLSSVAQGRGAHLSLNATFADYRDPELVAVRPMREFSMKEIVMYNVLNDVKTVTMTSLTTMMDEKKTSIQRLTQTFITGLQADFPATVSTVGRTGNKIECQSKSSAKCPMCKGPLDTIVPEASALQAAEFSASLARSRDVDDVITSARETACCGEGDGSCKSASSIHSISDTVIMKALCYGCRRLMNDVSCKKDVMTPEILADIAKAERRSAMKADIEEFLIDDDS